MIDKDKQYKRQAKWKAENTDKVFLEIPKGLKEKWRAQADAEGLSLSKWIQKKVSQG